MPRIGFRECHFVKVSNIDGLIEELKKSINDWGIPKEYDLRVYKSVYACCGVSDSNIGVEIIGPDEKGIKEIDMKIMSKLIELCQKNGFEYHVCDRIEIA